MEKKLIQNLEDYEKKYQTSKKNQIADFWFLTNFFPFQLNFKLTWKSYKNIQQKIFANLISQLKEKYKTSRLKLRKL